MKRNLSTEEEVILKELKIQLMNALNHDERHTILKDIERLLTKAKYRNRFMSTLKDNETL